MVTITGKDAKRRNAKAANATAQTPPDSGTKTVQTGSEQAVNLPRPVRRCVTHHFACDCGEARFRKLLEDTIHAHSTPDNYNYNECDKDPCAWCEEAKALIFHGQTHKQRY